MSDLFKFENWGLIPYQEAFARMNEYLLEIHKGMRSQTIIFCTHPAVVTTGRATENEDVFAWSGEVIEVNRGGRATYHGPNQIIIYPIFNIEKCGVQKFIRTLEEVIIEALADLKINAVGSQGDCSGKLTGVWVDNKKICSIGIAIRHWISSHGLALNLYRDENAFIGMKPCGMSADTMTSLEEVSGKKFDRISINNLLTEILIEKLSPLYCQITSVSEVKNLNG